MPKRLVFDSSKKILKKPSGPAPDISIVVIALNEEKRIVPCIESLRNQTFKGKFEIILADGYSEDRTVELALPLVDGLILEKNRNCAFERNAGSLLARGKIITFCDSDSVIPSDWLEKIWRHFDKPEEKQPIGVYGASGFHDSNWFENRFILQVMRCYALLQKSLGRFAPANSNYAFQRSVWLKLDGMDTRFKTSEDHEFFSRACKLGKIAFDPWLVVYTSARRVKKMGYLGFIAFQSKVGYMFYHEGKSFEEYEDIR